MYLSKIKFFIITFVFLSFFNYANAQVGFDSNLYYGISGSELVKNLQQFLKDQGMYTGPVNGNFYSQTLSGVQSFQRKHGIPPTGYFGPISRSQANKIFASGKNLLSEASTSISNTAPIVSETGAVIVSSVNILKSKIDSAYQQVLLLQKKLKDYQTNGGNKVNIDSPQTTLAVTSTPIPVVTQSVVQASISTVTSTPTPMPVVNITPTINVSTKFYIGERVQTSATLNVKELPSLGSKLLDVKAGNSLGIITHGPVWSDGMFWWYVNYDVGADGWSSENYLFISFIPVPTPSLIVLTSTPAPVSTPTPTFVPTLTSASNQTNTQTSKKMMWGAYVGDSGADLSAFESKVGKQVNIRSVFYGMGDNFPLQYKSTIGASGKTLLIFWEPAFGYDIILDGSQDGVINKFVSDAKTYGYPVILSPFHEMNGDWSPWGYGVNSNTTAKFILAWRKLKDMFVSALNVKFALVYNSDSKPNIRGNQIPDYYPGDAYVDYVGVDGFNFGNPWMSFDSIFRDSLAQISKYNKPGLIFSIGATSGTEKGNWIRDALGVQIYKYPFIEGWVWFNQDAFDGNWLVDSDSSSLSAFKDIVQKI